MFEHVREVCTGIVKKLEQSIGTDTDCILLPSEVIYILDWMDASYRELAALREQVRWIPVSERLPEYQQRVLFFSERISLGVHSEKARYWATDGYTYPGDWYNTVTHWMTLPQPPEAE